MSASPPPPRVAGSALAIVVLWMLSGCAEKKPPPRPPSPPPISPDTTRSAPRFSAYPVGGSASLRELQRRLGPDRFLLFLKVNRVDLGHVREGDTLSLPDSSLRELEASPFPARVAVADSFPKLLLVSLRVQAFAAYERGSLVHWGPTSSGRQELPTPPALYHANWKAKVRHSTVDESWILKWCVNLSRVGISMHEFELPGRPASHSCVRLLAEDAEWVYGWVDQWQVSPDGRTVAKDGTPVLVFGTFAFGRRPPWRDLATHPESASVSLAEIDSALAGLQALSSSAILSAPARNTSGSGNRLTTR
jgi:hypothetical protein